MDFEELLRYRIKQNLSALEVISECDNFFDARHLLKELNDDFGVDAIEGFLRAGLDESLPYGERALGYLYGLDDAKSI